MGMHLEMPLLTLSGIQRRWNDAWPESVKSWQPSWIRVRIRKPLRCWCHEARAVARKRLSLRLTVGVAVIVKQDGHENQNDH